MIGVMTAEIVPFGPSRPQMEELIHRLVREGKYALEPELRRKMHERDFSMRQVLETMGEGSINQGPRLDECNDWRCRLKKRVAGKLVRVVVAVHDMSFVYAISVH
jgi:hypothetical protein